MKTTTAPPRNSPIDGAALQVPGQNDAPAREIEVMSS
jgi:hypothetical protein